jgi:phospholipid/cholesterol/gamma-HCH transport system substrate-binding protein
MRLIRRTKIQLTIFVIVSLIAGGVMAFGYLRLPSMLFGVGRYKVVLELPETGGLYQSSNVTYRGQEVGRVTEVRLTDTGVEAVLSLNSSVPIPADLDAEVHSQSAVGEQFVELIPRGAGPAPLKDGDVIPLSRASVPPDINSLLNATNRGLEAIPPGNLKTTIDEGYIALAGLGPEFARFVNASTKLAIDAKKNLGPLTTLVDQSKPVLDSQGETSEAIDAWAAHIADITRQLRDNDVAVRGVLDGGPGAAGQVRQVFDRLQPALPVLLANLTSVADVTVTYHPNVEQLLVLLPQSVAILDSALVPDLYSKSIYRGPFTTFDLNINIPPPCLTGYLPPNQQRATALVDHPDRPQGDLYCRVPQDSNYNVRGARNIPCETKPGKRAPTAAMCESDEQYVPLNEGYNWKGDPNATLSGQDIPQAPPRVPTAAVPPLGETASPPIAFAEYDPAAGNYVGPDGQLYTQANLAQQRGPQTWQSMLLPPEGN